jgi:hypothetical protein
MINKKPLTELQLSKLGFVPYLQIKNEHRYTFYNPVLEVAFNINYFSGFNYHNEKDRKNTEIIIYVNPDKFLYLVIWKHKDISIVNYLVCGYAKEILYYGRIFNKSILNSINTGKQFKYKKDLI